MTSRFFDYGAKATEATEAARDPGPRGILSGLTPQDWTHLIGFAARVRYAAGKDIIAAGQNEPAIYFLVRGTVRIVQPRPGGIDTEIGVLQDGAVFGIQGFVDHRPSAATATAVTETEVLSLTPTTFAQLASWHPRIGIALMSDLAANLASRLRQHEVMT